MSCWLGHLPLLSLPVVAVAVQLTHDRPPSMPPGDTDQPPTQRPSEPQPRAENMTFPLEPWTCNPAFSHIPGACGDDNGGRPHFGIWALPNANIADAKRSPITHDSDGNYRRVFVGVDQGTDTRLPSLIVASCKRSRSADQTVPFDGDVGGPAEVVEFLMQHQREEGAEDVAADRRLRSLPLDRNRDIRHDGASQLEPIRSG